MEFGTVVKVTGSRHDTAAYPTAVVLDSSPVMGGGERHRAILLPSQNGGCLIETNLYTGETGAVVCHFGAGTTVALIWRCRDLT